MKSTHAVQVLAALGLALAIGSGGVAAQSATTGGAPKIGSSLIGKLEGPEIIRDDKAFPKTFKEAPILADQVKAGKLPTVDKRLPETSQLLVVKPLKEIGKYGGNWRRAFTGPADHENGNRINSSDKILTFDYTGTKIIPSLARDWKVSDDGKTTTIYLRKGAKWSDGTPFTANDFMFWYEDIYLNKNITPTPFFEFQINGKDGKMRKIDDYTVAFEFPEPYAFFVYQLAGSTAIGAGFATRGGFQNFGGAFAPAHYLKQFLPKYSSEEAVNKKAKDLGFDSYVSLLKNRYSWALNNELPVMTPWKTVSPINTPTWSMERNPYFWAVDTAGNQLPYIDRITMTLAENTEVANLRAIAGEYDLQERHMHLSKLPIFLDNAKKGNYAVHLDPGLNGSDVALHIGNSYTADPEISKLLKNKDFRHALALGIDRDQLNEAFWLGVGTAGSVAPAPDTIYSPGPEWNKKWGVLDVKQANDLLDKVGLTKKDADGYRLRTDGKGRLRLEMVTVGAQFVPYTQVGEMIKQQWRQDRHRCRYQGARAQSRVHPRQQQREPDHHLGQRRLRNSLPVPPACAARRCGGGTHGHGLRPVVFVQGRVGNEAYDPEMLRAMDLFRDSFAMKEEDRIKAAKEIWKIIVEQTWSIGTVGQSPAFMGVRIVKNNMGNIPERQINAQHARTPFTSQPITFYFK